MKFVNKTFLIVFLTLVALGITGFTLWNSVKSQNVDRISIENKTPNLKVESVKEVEVNNNSSRFEATFRNTYDKPIAVYRFNILDKNSNNGEVASIERGGLTDGWVLKPNETSVSRFSASKEGKIFLVITSVLFEDGDGKGDTDDLNTLRELRKGVSIGFQKIIPILKEETSNVGDSLYSENNIQLLERKIEQIDDKGISDNYKRGFYMAKDFIVSEIKDIQEKINQKRVLNPILEITSKISGFESQLAKISANTPMSLEKKGGKNE